MKKNVSYACLIMIALFYCTCGYAQTIDPQQLVGKIVFPKSSINFNTGNVPAAAAARLKSSLANIQNMVLQNRLLKQPVGFDVSVNDFVMHVPTEINWQKQPPAVLSIGLLDLYIDKNTQTTKTSGEAYADLDIEINSFRRLYENSFEDDLSKVNHASPVFFFRYSQKQKDSTSNYIEFEITTGTVLRVITNGKSLFIPFTQEQYVRFKITSDQKNADDAEKQYEHDKKTMAESSSKQQVLVAEKKLADTWLLHLNRHQQQLNNMGAPEKIKPACILYGGNNTDEIEELTRADDPNGRELWTINPDYFNPNLTPGDVQLIVIKPEYHPHMASAFIKKKIMDIYATLDYQKLKTLIQ
jgi:hypothetical protein